LFRQRTSFPADMLISYFFIPGFVSCHFGSAWPPQKSPVLRHASDFSFDCFFFPGGFDSFCSAFTVRCFSCLAESGSSPGFFLPGDDFLVLAFLSVIVYVFPFASRGQVALSLSNFFCFLLRSPRMTFLFAFL